MLVVNPLISVVNTKHDLSENYALYIGILMIMNPVGALLGSSFVKYFVNSEINSQSDGVWKSHPSIHC